MKKSTALHRRIMRRDAAIALIDWFANCAALYLVKLPVCHPRAAWQAFAAGAPPIMLTESRLPEVFTGEGDYTGVPVVLGCPGALPPASAWFAFLSRNHQ